MRPSVIAVTLGMLAACGGLTYLHLTRDAPREEAAGLSEPAHTAVANDPPPLAAPVRSDGAASADAPTQAIPQSDQTAASNKNVATPDSVAQWIKDTSSPDAETRAAAIAALADAPAAQALPALERVLDSGEPSVDRHIALRSMYSLALRDGDTNGQIRDVMRHALYHGDDDGVTQTAQSLLDDMEAEFSQREQSSN